MVRKVVVVISVLITGFLTYYFFVKSYDYLITIKAKTSVGTVNQSIKLWNGNLDSATLLTQNTLNNLTQQITINDSIHLYDWNIKSLNDSSSVINVYIKDINNSFFNKITMPFGHTNFEKRVTRTVIDFSNKLTEHLSKIKVRVQGIASTPQTYCAYVSMTGLQIEKERGMMKNYTFLSNFLYEGHVEMNGTPFIEISRWNKEKDSINYNFCFPIIKSDSLPKHHLISYKQQESVKALKATYNGNYITSDRAWYALLEHAERNAIKVSETPIEVFYNNPNFGGDELQWNAEIFMPLIDQE